MKKEELVELISNSIPDDTEVSIEHIDVLIRNYTESRRIEVFLEVINTVIKVTYSELSLMEDFSIFIENNSIQIEFHDKVNCKLEDKISKELTDIKTEGFSISVKEIYPRIVKWEVI